MTRLCGLPRGIAVVAALALSACVLSSQKPYYDDSRAQLIFGDKPLSFAAFSRDDHGWKAADAPQLSVIPEGRHYLIPDPDHPGEMSQAITVRFVPVNAHRYVLQLTDTNDLYYGFADWDGTELLVFTLWCDKLQERPELAALIDFQKYSCALTASPDHPSDLPAILQQDLPPPDFRMVRLP